jgi:hypothetical protein
MRTKKGNAIKFGIAGFARVQIRQDGLLVGDSGWVHNVMTDYGMDEGLGQVLASQVGSVRAGYAALGTGGAPTTATTALPGENAATAGRDALSYVTVTAANATGVTSRYYGTFGSSESRVTNTIAIANIGLYTGSGTSGSNLLCGATYTVSTLNTNQDVNYSYEWRFQTM